jgi:hypothetical protein
MIRLSFCFKCDAITLNSESDECACGTEFYPVEKHVPDETRIYANDSILEIQTPRGERKPFEG